MKATEALVAVAFYIGLVALCAGGITAARGVVEKKQAPLVVPLLIVGAIAIVAAVVTYMHGPRNLLPF